MPAVGSCQDPSSKIPMTSKDDNPSLPDRRVPLPVLISALQTCPKCDHLARDGFKGNNIHMTLAYSRCRCHRTWKYGIPSPEDTEPDIITRRAQPKPHIDPEPFTTKSLLSNQAVSKFQGRRRRRHLPPLKDRLIPHKIHYRNEIKKSHLTSTKLPEIPDSLQHPEALSTALTISKSNLTSKLSSTSLLHHGAKNISSSSVTKLPQIIASTSKTVLPTVGPSNKHSLTQQRRKSEKMFEFIHLIRYVPADYKLTATEMFARLDQNGDGHLSFPEVLSGLKQKFKMISSDTLETYLKPVYHVLGDTTYFGKRDFILCYSMTTFLQDIVLPQQLDDRNSPEFYQKIMKPLMFIIEQLSIEGKVSINCIEGAVEKYNSNSLIKLVFNKSRAYQISSEGSLSVISILILAPCLFSIM